MLHHRLINLCGWARNRSLSGIVWVNLKYNHMYSCGRKQEGVRDRHTEEKMHAKGKAVWREGQVGLMWLGNAKGWWQLLEAGNRHQIGSPQEPLEGVWPCQPWFQIFGLQNCKKINVCCFKPPNLWQSVTVVEEPNNSCLTSFHSPECGKGISPG